MSHLSSKKSRRKETALELCAGGGGETIGLWQAGFSCKCAVEIDVDACETLRSNKPRMNVLNTDLREFDAKPFEGIDLVAGGPPCPPFSIAGKQLGELDERDLFPDALRIVRDARPKAVMLENVRGFSSSKFAPYRKALLSELRELGYSGAWRLLNASDFGVSQLRPRFILVALKHALVPFFRWPSAVEAAPSVGECLYDLMAANGWAGTAAWAEAASTIAPTIVGGSKKHGGPDLGPSRAKKQWLELRVNGSSIANEAPDNATACDAIPRLTNRMVARLQSFPDEWHFAGKKTSQYRQIGNAFPAAVAKAVAGQIRDAIRMKEIPKRYQEELFASELVAGA